MQSKSRRRDGHVIGCTKRRRDHPRGQACQSFDSAAAEPCKSTCLKLIRQHADGCGAFTDPMTRGAVASWGPLLALCRGQSDPDGSGGIVAQCAAAQTKILGQLSTACCTDSLCAAMPKTCPRVCPGLLRIKPVPLIGKLS